MKDTAEYEHIFNMSINDRRQLLKEKDIDFKKEYFAYDNRERARQRREAKRSDKVPIEQVEQVKQVEKVKQVEQVSHISQKTDDIVKKVLNTPLQSDKYLSKDGKMFKEKVDLFFKQTIPREPVKEPTPIPPQPIINLPPIKEKTGDETIYHETIYANTIISKNYITDDGEDGLLNENSPNNIKNYNIKIPVEHLKDIYIKMPNNNSSLIIDGEYCYVFFN